MAHLLKGIGYAYRDSHFALGKRYAHRGGILLNGNEYPYRRFCLKGIDTLTVEAILLTESDYA